MIRIGFVMVFLAIAFQVQGQPPCGCPYKPKTAVYGPLFTQYNPSKLIVMDASNKSCTITCESGYKLENTATYSECTNGVNWIGQQRETFTTQKLIENPFLTCIKVETPKTCPTNTWKTFTCNNCDPSKIMVAQGNKGDCTIMCDKGYRLLGNKGSDPVLKLAEATLKGTNWIMFSIGSINTSESAAAATVTFNCEPIPVQKQLMQLVMLQNMELI